MGNRIVEEDHHPVAGETFERALVFMHQRAHRRVVFGEHAHHLFGLAGLGERREVPQIGEEHHDFAAMAFQEVLVAGDEIGQLWRQEAAQPARPLQLGHLRSDPGLQFGVPSGQFGRLPPDRVVVALDAGQ